VPCENYPHRYDPTLQIYLPFCVNQEPLGAPWVLPNAHILVPFESSVFAAFHAPYLAELVAQRQPGISSSFTRSKSWSGPAISEFT